MINAIKDAFLNMTKPPFTHGYPAVEIKKPSDYRGLIKYSAEHCIFCDICEKVCPPDAILFKQLEDGTKVYNYNAHLCIFCGDCVSECPKAGAALWQSEDKALPAVKNDNVSDNWDVLEEECIQGRIAFKIKKDADKKAKLAAKAAAAAPTKAK